MLDVLKMAKVINLDNIHSLYYICNIEELYIPDVSVVFAMSVIRHHLYMELLSFELSIPSNAIEYVAHEVRRGYQ